MRRLVHSDEAERRSGPRRAGFGMAVAVAGLMGAAGCATTHATPPRYSLTYGESAPMNDFGMSFSAVRLRETVASMTARHARYWVENSSGDYSSLLTLSAPNVEAFTGMAYIEADGRWYFLGAVRRYSAWLRTARGANAVMPSQMEIMEDIGVCRMDAEPFRAIIRQVSGRDAVRMRPISEETTGLCPNGLGYIPVTTYKIHFLPLDAGGNMIGQYRGGQLALTTSYSPNCPELGCLRGMGLLVDPGTEDPRNVRP